MHPNNRQKTDILFQDFEEILNNLKVFVCGSNRTMSSRYPHRASEQVRYINISVGEKFDWSITYTKIDRSLDVFFSYPYEGQKYLYIFSFSSPPRDANTSLHKYMKKHLREPPIPVGGDYDTCSEFVYLTDVLLPGYDDRIPKCSILVDGGSIYFSKLAPSGTNRTRYNIDRDGFVVVKFSGGGDKPPPRVIKLKFGAIEHFFLIEKVEDRTFFTILQTSSVYKRVVSKMFEELDKVGRCFVVRETGAIELGTTEDTLASQSDVLKYSLEDITSMYGSVDGVERIEMYEYSEHDVTCVH